jgi:hypothetical protein
MVTRWRMETAGASCCQIQAATFSEVGFSRPSISLRG